MILAALVRFIHLSADPAPGMTWSGCLATDEGRWTGGAVNMVRHGSFIVEGDLNNVVLNPLLQVLYAAVFRLAGIGLVQARLVSVLSSLGMLALVFAVLRKRAGPLIACVCVLLCATMYVPFVYGRLAFCEPFVSLCLIAALWLLLDRPCGRASTWMAGLAFALALLSKPSAASFAIPAGEAVLLFGHRRLALLWVVALPLALVVGWLLLVNARWGDVLQGQRQIAGPDAASLTDFLRAAGRVVGVGGQGYPGVWPWLVSSAYLWVPAAYALAPRHRAEIALCLLWLFAALLQHTTKVYYEVRYTLPLLPPITLALGLLMAGLRRRTDRWASAWIVVLVGVLAATAYDGGRVAAFLAYPRCSVADAAREVDRTMASQAQSPRLLGASAAALSLAAGGFDCLYPFEIARTNSYDAVPELLRKYRPTHVLVPADVPLRSPEAGAALNRAETVAFLGDQYVLYRVVPPATSRGSDPRPGPGSTERGFR